jgi:ATP-dependent Clp protease ATP-binding subunit ClpA
MFERYTEKARRVIFFARYEASKFGSHNIETEHLLLALLREDRPFRDRLPPGAEQVTRSRIDELAPRPNPSISTSVDLPLSEDSKRALQYAAEESKALGHPYIDCSHLLLGLLRIETSMAAVLLQGFGIRYASYREEVAAPPAAPPLQLLGDEVADLQRLSGAIKLANEGAQRLKRTGWTRKEALGHLIDWAAAHQQWFARALAEPRLIASGYPEDGWLSVQHYNDLPWLELADLCISINRLIVHVIEHIPEAKIDTPCRIGIAEPIPLQELVRRYVAHCDDIVGQLLKRE